MAVVIFGEVTSFEGFEATGGAKAIGDIMATGEIFGASCL